MGSCPLSSAPFSLCLVLKLGAGPAWTSVAAGSWWAVPVTCQPAGAVPLACLGLLATSSQLNKTFALPCFRNLNNLISHLFSPVCLSSPLPSFFVTFLASCVYLPGHYQRLSLAQPAAPSFRCVAVPETDLSPDLHSSRPLFRKLLSPQPPIHWPTRKDARGISSQTALIISILLRRRQSSISSPYLQSAPTSSSASLPTQALTSSPDRPNGVQRRGPRSARRWPRV